NLALFLFRTLEFYSQVTMSVDAPLTVPIALETFRLDTITSAPQRQQSISRSACSELVNTTRRTRFLCYSERTNVVFISVFSRYSSRAALREDTEIFAHLLDSLP